MSVDLFHHMVLDMKADMEGEKENVVDFPECSKDKFKDFIFFELVEYIDWEATVKAVMQMDFAEFSANFEMFLETSDGLYYWCPKGSENPLGDPDKIVFHHSQCLTTKSFDPHLMVKCIGGHRGGVNPKFYEHFDANQILCERVEVKEMLKYCDGSESVESFIENFLLNWTELSFVTVSY